MKAKLYYALILVFTCCHVLVGQGYMSPAGIMISHAHSKGGFMLSYIYMNMDMKDNLSGTDRLSNEAIWNNYIFAPQNMNMDMHMLMGMYGITDRFSLMATTVFIKNSMDVALPPGTVLVHHHDGSEVDMPDETQHSHATAGFGDIKLEALYKVFEMKGSSLLLSAGISVPTGKFNIEAGAHALYPGQRHTYMMQLGTGSLDFMPGLTYLKSIKQLTWSAQVLGTIRPFYNTIGYHYGNDVTLNAWVADQFFPFMSASVRFQYFAGGTIKGSDPKLYKVLEPDADPDCYGGQWVNGYAGVNFYIRQSFMCNSKVTIEAGIPLYQNVNGVQLANYFVLNAGITKSF